MTNIETRLGLTPIFKRLAYSYLVRGFGEYSITEDPLYDGVKVEPMYPWQVNPEDTNDSGAGIRVVFYRTAIRVRWVEFSVRFIGGGGDAMMFGVKDEP